VKITISKGRILMLVLPTFILIMFILEIICGEAIFDKFLTLSVVAFLYQLGQKIGSIDEKVKGIGPLDEKVSSLAAQVKGISSRLGIVEKKVL